MGVFRVKQKIFSAFLLLTLAISFTVTAFAYTVPGTTRVYITPTGECYHRKDCSYIKNSFEESTVAAAEADGYRACSRCDPDVLTGEYESNWDGGGGGGGEMGNPSSTQKHTPIWKELLEILWGIVCAIFSIFISAAAFSAIIYPIKWVLEFFARLRKK